MQKIKQLNSLIDQTCSERHNQPPANLYNQVLTFVQSRVDMPKYVIAAISKKLSSKQKKELYICFDLLEFLSYHLQLSFFAQIATKQFLFKISGIMISKDVDSVILDKILNVIKCLDELFRPLQDLVPLFFQFQAGLLRKQFQIPHDYVSPYRPKQLKKYKKPQKKQEVINKKPIIQPSKSEQKTFEQIRMKLLITNEIIDNCNPSQNVKNNDLLIEMMQALKACEKKINETINQNPSQMVMQLALATNDDLYITFRRYKDLQRNRKPEPFILTELASDMIKQQHHKKQQKSFKTNAYRTQVKVQQKPQIQNSSIFDLLQNKQQSKIQLPLKSKIQQPLNIFDLDLDNTESKLSQPTNASNILDLMDISEPQNTTNSMMNMNFLGISNNVSNDQGLSNLNNLIFSMNLNGNSQIQSNNPFLGNNNQQQELAGSINNLQAPYQNITLNTNEQQKVKEKVDIEKFLSGMGDFPEFLQSMKNNNNQFS